jgi:hypothetical protein
LHGIAVERAPGHIARGPGRLVPMAQPQRGLIPLLLDEQAAEPMVDGVRLVEFRPSPTGPVLCGREG